MVRAGGNCRGFRMRQGGNRVIPPPYSLLYNLPHHVLYLNWTIVLYSSLDLFLIPLRSFAVAQSSIWLTAKKLCVSLILDPGMGVAKGGAVVCLIVPSVESFYTFVRSFEIQSQQTTWCVYSRREAESKSQGSRVSEATARILSLLHWIIYTHTAPWTLDSLCVRRNVEQIKNMEIAAVLRSMQKWSSSLSFLRAMGM